MPNKHFPKYFEQVMCDYEHYKLFNMDMGGL